MVNSRICETERPRFRNSRPRLKKPKILRAQKILRDVTKVDMIRTCSPATYSCEQFRSDEEVHLFQLIEALIIFRLPLMDVSN